MAADRLGRGEGEARRGGARRTARVSTEREGETGALISDGLTGSVDGALAQEERRRNGRTGCLIKRSGAEEPSAPPREGGGENRGRAREH